MYQTNRCREVADVELLLDVLLELLEVCEQLLVLADRGGRLDRHAQRDAPLVARVPADPAQFVIMSATSQCHTLSSLRFAASISAAHPATCTRRNGDVGAYSCMCLPACVNFPLRMAVDNACVLSKKAKQSKIHSLDTVTLTDPSFLSAARFFE
jgi:hypothetical protein